MNASEYPGEVHLLAKTGQVEVTWLDDPFVITALVEKQEHGYSAEFWVSGRTWRGSMGLIMRLQVGLQEIRDRSQAEGVCQQLWDTTLRELSYGSALVEGIPNLTAPLGKAMATNLAHTHLWAHNRMGSFADHLDTRESRRAALMYQLITAFGYKQPIQMMQELEGLPLSTISQRLTMARNAGMLPKRRESVSQSTRSRKETTKET